MKNTLYILILTTLGCNTLSKDTIKRAHEDTTKHIESSRKQYYATQDTVLIATETGDTLTFSKEDFNQIVDTHSEFFEKFPLEPDQAYERYGSEAQWRSEAGQDRYYALYAYFLKQENGIHKYASQRKKIIDIYTHINSLFAHIQYGGTYFGHQNMRILGYAEYSICLLPKNKDDFEKTYDIAKQKALYIKSLRQLIEDESEIDFKVFGKEKAERNNQLNRIVDDLEKLITDIFYLRRAQEFQYRYYEYY